MGRGLKGSWILGGWDPGGVDREGHGWKLTAITAQCEALATDAAAKGWAHVDYLRRLFEGSGNMTVTYLAGSSRECHSHERES